MLIDDETANDNSQLVATFLLGGAAFGIGTEVVQEVVKVGEITPIHHAPPHIVGIRNLRGHIVTVVDLGIRLELGAISIGPESRIIIVDLQGEPVGLLVDSVADTITLDKEDISPAPPNVHGVQGRNFAGVYRAHERLIALLNLETVLKADERLAKEPAGKIGPV